MPEVWEQNDPVVAAAPWEQSDPLVQGPFPERVGGAFVRGTMRLAGALVDLPKHIVNQVKMLPMATMADEVLAAKDPVERAAKLKDMAAIENFFDRVTNQLGKAGELHRVGQAAILRNHPEWVSEPPKSFIDLVSSPDKLVVALAESTPLLLGAGILTAAGAPQIGVMMMYASEGQEAYDRAIAYGASKDDAERSYLIYGTVAAALENMQLRHIMKIGKGVWNQVLNRTVQKVGREGARSLTWEVIKVAAKEALEEVSQGRWGDITANVIYGEPFGSIGEIVDRSLQEAYIGFMMGVIPGAAAGTAARTQQQRVVRKFTGKDSPLKTQQYAILTAENPGNRPLSAEENAARNTELVADLDAIMKVPISVQERYGGPVKNSFLVFGLTDEQVLELGKKYEQESVLTSKGLIYQDGAVNPVDLENINFDPGQVDYYSTVDVAGRSVKFSIPIDFETKEPLVPTEPIVPEAVEKIRAAAYYNPNTNQISEGITHAIAASKMKEFFPTIEEGKPIPEGMIEGFVTESGKFISNEEAIEIAKKSGQLKKDYKLTQEERILGRPTAQAILKEIKPTTSDEAIGKQYGLEPAETQERLSKAELQYRELKTKPVADRTKAENKELAFLGRNRKNVKALLARDTEPLEPKRMSRKQALILGHKIPDQLGWNEDQRRDFMKEITGVRSMKNMVPAQREQIVAALQRKAKEAGIEVDVPDSTPAGELAAKLRERKQKPALSRRDRRNMKRLRKILYTMKSGTSFYFLHSSRLKRLCRSLDNYEENGPFMRYIYQPVKSADTKANANFTNEMAAAIITLNDLNIDAPAMMVEVIDIGIKDKLSTAERIGVWALAQNNHTMNHLRSEFSEEEIGKIVKSVEATEKEMLVAVEVQTYFEQGWPTFQAIAEANGITRLTKAENYVTAFVTDKNDLGTPNYLEGLMEQFTEGKFVPGQQHTIERKRGAMRNLELNIFVIHARAARALERFKVMAPVASEVGSILSNKEFKQAINDVTYGHGARVFDRWLQDAVRGQAAYDSSALARSLRWLRMAGIHFVLGFKILTAAKQGISFLPAASVHPSMLPLLLANLERASIGLDYSQMEKNAMAKSDLLRTRDWNRDLRQVYNQKAIRKMYEGKKLSPMSMRMATFIDRHTCAIVWTSAYQLAQRQDMSEEESVRFADGVIEDTQPMGKAVDLPSYFRGHELEKNLTVFQNQINQNGNIFWYEILGETKARKISLPMAGYRLLMSQIVPAMLLGMVTRGRPPESIGEIAKDLLFYIMCPFVFVGRWAYNVATGDWGPTRMIAEAPFVETGRLVSAIRKGFKKGLQPGELKTIARYSARTVGAWTGGKIPLQAISTAEGAWDLATEQDDDFRRLVWSKYALQKKKVELRKKFAR